MTPLDAAHAAMAAAPGDAAAERAFYARLAEAELFLMLTADPDGDRIDPAVFETGDGAFALAFDREDRLAEFAGHPVPYAALSGRRLAALLAEAAIGLALNPGGAPSETVLTAEALAWLAETAGADPRAVTARLTAIHPPAGLPRDLLTALDARLAAAEGLARLAYVVGTEAEGGGQGHLVAFVDAVAGAEPALARAVSEALAFSGLEAGALDVAFFAAEAPMAARLARHGLRIDLPQPAAPTIPGGDPNAPPRLR
ncbi:SseB family protein [Rhodobacteraceae bacterium CCMM004]|nr:SseB family protein [Rhodobacteraceae bacterium CCMM004]